MPALMVSHQRAGGMWKGAGEPGISHLALLLHAGLGGSILLVLTAINALVDQSTWWVLWVAWAWSMVLALHAGATLRWHGWLGAHFGVTALFSLGLIVANLALGGGWWSAWVVVVATAPLIGHWLFARRQMPLLVAQSVASGILMAEVVVANVLYPSDRWNAGLSIAGSGVALALLMAGSILAVSRRSAVRASR